jgi:uncharacterized protein (TIGR02145 family)
MKKYYIGILSLICCLSLLAQEEKLVVDGSIKIENSTLPIAQPGTIRWTGTDFEGFTGFEWTSLTGASSEGTVTDADGNIYKTKKIGDTFWMTENLRTTKYLNGTSIAEVSNGSQWTGLNVGGWCWYDNNNSLEIPYGKLYNWYAVIDPNGLCPVGWAVPEHSDYLQLANFLGGLNTAGGKMKETGTIHWTDPNDFATNESGFTGLPGGFRDSNAAFQTLGMSGAWWDRTEDFSKGFSVRLFNNSKALSQVMADKIQGRSVRCIKLKPFQIN